MSPGTSWHDVALELAGEDPRLLAHSIGVATSCWFLAAACGLPDAEQATARDAGLLHDLGKSTALSRPGELHHLSGARMLRERGEERLAALVAHHSGGRFEADLAGVGLGDYARERSTVADVLDLCDLTTRPDGRTVPIRARYAEIRVRYRVPVDEAIALDHFRGDLVGVVERTLRSIADEALRDRATAAWVLPAPHPGVPTTRS